LTPLFSDYFISDFSMYKIKTEPEKNRMTITLSGILTLNESAACKNEIEQEAEKLNPGFDVINDFSTLRFGQDTSGQFLTEVMKYFIGMKVKRIVRVVGASEGAMVQFAQLTSAIKTIEFKYVPTLREAELFLEGKSKS
jgi:hypothetical protein